MWLALVIAAAESVVLATGIGLVGESAGGGRGAGISTDAARRWALLLMLVSLIGITLLVVVAAAWVLRRGRRLRDSARNQAPTPMTDAWAEAGRRARGDLLGGEGGEGGEGEDSWPGGGAGGPRGGGGSAPIEPPERPDTSFDPPIEPDERRP